jgi:AraC-like DNA-binding protein
MGPEPFVKSYLEAWNRNDAQAVGEHLARDGVYRDIPAGLTQNREALIESLLEFFGDAPHRYELIGDVVCDAHRVAFQYRMVPLDPYADELGLKTVQGAEFIHMEKGLASSISDYYQLDQAIGESVSAGRTSGRRKYAKSGLSTARIERYKQRLKALMEAEALYLNPDLTLPRLAERLDCSVNHLSQVINAGLGMSFFDWVSQQRIERAKTLLKHDDPQPVLNIAYAVGFNSNSAFYAAFKKWVGTTPTAYRDRSG